MRVAKGTFCLEQATMERLQSFSRRTGIPQSALVDEMVKLGLTRLEKNWRSVDSVLKDAFKTIPQDARLRLRHGNRKSK